MIKESKPIKDKNIINLIANQLEIKSNRLYVLFRLGIDVGACISDLVLMKKSDIVDDSGNVKRTITFTESKTKLSRSAEINDCFINILSEYLKGNSNSEYLFPSMTNNSNPVTSHWVRKMMEGICKDAGINLTNQTFKRTYGYQLYKITGDLELVRSMFGHKDVSITKNYIDI